MAFVDQFGLWTALAIFTNRRMTAEDLTFVSALLPIATPALRSAAAAQALKGCSPAAAPPEHDGPSVLILNRDDRIVTVDATARRRLAMVPEPRQIELPGLIAFVSAQARWGADGRSSTARMRTDDGRWFLVNASRLDSVGSGSPRRLRSRRGPCRTTSRRSTRRRACGADPSW